MPRIVPFEKYTSQYEAWFEAHYFTYQSELLAVRQMLPGEGEGIEIGLGSGRFATPFGIRYGIEPSQKMIEVAVQKQLRVIKGIAEALPIGDAKFDFALMVTTICFLDEIEKALQEIYRILRPNGVVIIGFVDKKSPIGREYRKHKKKNVFYRVATFYSVREVFKYLRRTGFYHFESNQTIFRDLNLIIEIEPVKPGYGLGSFVVIKGKKNRLN